MSKRLRCSLFSGLLIILAGIGCGKDGQLFAQSVTADSLKKYFAADNWTRVEKNAPEILSQVAQKKDWETYGELVYVYGRSLVKLGKTDSSGERPYT